MVFNSLTFIVFFACVLALHALPLPWTAKKANLLVASYLFYAAWNPPFVILLWVSTIVDWYAALGLVRAQRPAARRAWMLLSVVVNLGMLAWFKYGNFLLANFNALVAPLGVQWQAPHYDIVLPVGISFYTFATLSYTLDVYLRRGWIPAKQRAPVADPADHPHRPGREIGRRLHVGVVFEDLGFVGLADLFQHPSDHAAARPGVCVEDEFVGHDDLPLAWWAS